VDWKFWNKVTSPAPGTSERPTDTYEALRLLLGMLMRADMPPFSNWHAPGVFFAPNVENTAQSATKGYQLALWFWLFAEKHGTIAARMVRESFCLLAEAAQPSSGDRIDALLDFENRLAHSIEEISSGARTFRLCDGSLWAAEARRR